MKKIPLGLCSSVAAVFVWLGIFGALVVVSLNQLFFFKHPIRCTRAAMASALQ